MKITPISNLFRYLTSVFFLILFIASCTSPKKTAGAISHANSINEIARDSILHAYLQKRDHPVLDQKSSFNLDTLELDYKDVAPIFQKNCILCHREKGNAPFALTSYFDIKKRAQVIKEALNTKLMPPWTPDPTYSTFYNAPDIDDYQRAKLIEWIDQGATLSNKADDLNYSRKTIPDTILRYDKRHVLCSNKDTYQCFSLDLESTKDRYISGFEVITDNPEILHHVTVFVAKKGDNNPSTWDCIESEVIGTQIGVWSRGKQPFLFDSDLGLKIPKGSCIVLQAHYAPEYKNHSGDISISLHYIEEVKKEVQFLTQSDLDFSIPANEVTVITIEQKIDSTISLIGLFPHFHFLGRMVECYALTPENKKIKLLRIDDWDYYFQGQYMFETAKTIPKGSIIFMNIVYDNTSKNQYQPNSPIRDVGFGHGAKDEMFVLCLTYMKYDENDENLKLGHLIE